MTETLFEPYQPEQSPFPCFNVTLTKLLTTRLDQTYKMCNPNGFLNDKKCLTEPSEPKSNYGLDNERSELIVHEGDEIGSYNSFEGREFSMNNKKVSKYKVIDKLGHGTFGQVFKCWDMMNNRICALKVLKNKKAYIRQGLLECSSLYMVNKYFDENGNRIVKMFDHFMYCDHLCIAFELLGTNLYQYIKENRNVGFKIEPIRKMIREIVESIECCHKGGIIHCDVKPENVLLDRDGTLKMIDLGSACFENYTLYSYIQSRHYRAPEIVFGNKYTTAIDMWSVGCIIAEILLGIPLFPADTEYDLLFRFIQILGMPSDEIISNSHSGEKYFKYVRRTGKFRFKESFEFEWEQNIQLQPHKNYLYYVTLEDIILKNPMKIQLKPTDSNLVFRESILDILKRIFVYDPRERLTADQLLQHPFFTIDDINNITTKDLIKWVPPQRKIPYKEYGHAVSSYPEDMMEDAFGEEIEIQRKLYHCEYYYIFQKLLMKGHVANVTIDNPFEYGSITPRKYMEVISQEKTVLKSHKGPPTTPRSFVAYCCEIVEKKKRESSNSEKIKNSKFIQIHSNKQNNSNTTNGNNSINGTNGRRSPGKPNSLEIKTKQSSKSRKVPPMKINPIRIDIIQNMNRSSNSNSNSQNEETNETNETFSENEDMNVEIDIESNSNENYLSDESESESSEDDNEIVIGDSSDEYLTDGSEQSSSDNDEMQKRNENNSNNTQNVNIIDDDSSSDSSDD